MLYTGRFRVTRVTRRLASSLFYLSLFVVVFLCRNVHALHFSFLSSDPSFRAQLDEALAPQSSIAAWAASLPGSTKASRHDRFHFHAFIGLLCQACAVTMFRFIHCLQTDFRFEFLETLGQEGARISRALFPMFCVMHGYHPSKVHIDGNRKTTFALRNIDFSEFSMISLPHTVSHLPGDTHSADVPIDTFWSQDIDVAVLFSSHTNYKMGTMRANTLCGYMGTETRVGPSTSCFALTNLIFRCSSSIPNPRVEACRVPRGRPDFC